MVTGDDIMKNLINKLTAVITALVLICGSAMPAAAEEVSISTSAKAAVVIEQKSGRVLYNQNADWELPMASTTKIMTAVVALKYGNLDDVIEVSEAASMVEGSSMYLEKGEKITLENLVYGLMLVSGNDAAVAIAENVGGSVERFVEMMNETAADLGLEHTHFDNANGLPSDTHYTTALELAKITKYAMDIPKFCEIVGTKTKSVPWDGHEYNRELTNHNKLLGTLDGCVGVKTGYTQAAGRCLVSAVTRDDMTLICVTLGDPNDWVDHTNLMNAMFEKYTQTELTHTDEVIDKIVVAGGLLGYTGVSPDKTYVFPVGESDDVRVDTSISENITFPVKVGDSVGSGIVLVNGEKYGEFNLIANSDIDLVMPSKENFWKKIKHNASYIFNYWLRLFSAIGNC